MEERKREWKKDSRRWNRQLMDCLLWADSGMSTDSHLHEQALSSKESMSQPPSPPLSLTNTHGQNATKIWLYWTVLLYHTLTVRQAHTRTHTHPEPRTSLLWDASWAVIWFLRSQIEPLTAHSFTEVTFTLHLTGANKISWLFTALQWLFFFVNHLEKTLCLVSQIRDLS